MDNTRQPHDSADDATRRSVLSFGVFIVAALSLLWTTLYAGGQPWAVLCLLVLVIQSLVDRRHEALAVIVPGLLWLVLFRITLNRELFFPYAMYLAAHVSLLLYRRSLWWGSVGGALIVAAFLAVRYQQYATGRVLAVELGVAGGILALVLLAYAVTPRNILTHLLIAAFASLLAYAGLSI